MNVSRVGATELGRTNPSPSLVVNYKCGEECINLVCDLLGFKILQVASEYLYV